MVTLETILNVLPAISVAIALVYYAMNLRNANKTRELSLKAQELSLRAQEQALETRQAQLFMQLYNVYNSLEYQKNHFYILSLEWEDFEVYWEKYGPFTNPETNAIIASEGGFFEGIGVMLKRKLIDITLVNELMAGNIIGYWEKIGPVVKEIRRTLNWPQALEWAEYLYQEIINFNHEGEKKVNNI